MAREIVVEGSTLELVAAARAALEKTINFKNFTMINLLKKFIIIMVAAMILIIIASMLFQFL